MIVECPGCKTIFPVDPKKVPEGGIHARCTVCNDVFFVSVPEGAPEEAASTDSAPIPEPEAPRTEDAFGEPMVKLDDAPVSPEEGFPPTEEPPGVDEEWAETEGWAEMVEGGGSEATLEEPEMVQEEPGIFQAEPETFQEEPETFMEEPETFQAEPETFQEEPETFQEEPGVPTEESEEPAMATPTFGKRDPKEKAQRLARVLVSDIILYNPDRHHAAMEAGRVKEEFEEEIQKSWTEYVEQVGEDVANNTSFFSEALNEILAKGDQIF